MYHSYIQFLQLKFIERLSAKETDDLNVSSLTSIKYLTVCVLVSINIFIIQNLMQERLNFYYSKPYNLKQEP